MLRLCVGVLCLVLLCRWSSTGMTERDVAAQVALWKGAVDVVRAAGVENVNVTMAAKMKPAGGYWKVGLELDPPLDVSLVVTTTVNPQNVEGD